MKHHKWHTGTNGAELIVYREDGFAVADAKTYHGNISHEQAVDHARLIASAPDLLEAVRIAYQLAGIASDWNLDEAEIDGRMRPIHRLEEIFLKAYRKATGKEPQ